MRKKGLGRHAPLTAKELAEMGFCEKRIQLAHLYGEQVAPEQQLAREGLQNLSSIRLARGLSVGDDGGHGSDHARP